MKKQADKIHIYKHRVFINKNGKVAIKWQTNTNNTCCGLQAHYSIFGNEKVARYYKEYREQICKKCLSEFEKTIKEFKSKKGR